jgi:uncharacterized RDD family membrane protein YckC
MGSALLDNHGTATREAAIAPREAADGPRETASPGRLPGDVSAMLSDASALRRQAAERVAAHRSRRIGAVSTASTAPSVVPRSKRSAKIAAAVAERYARNQSYHEFLAAEAERAVQQARSAAEMAAFNARALAAAEQRLLDALQQEDEAAEERGGQVTELVPQPPQIEDVSPAEPLLWAELEPDAAQPPAKRRGFQPPQPRRKQARRRPMAEPPVEAAIASDPTQNLAAGITIRLYQDESGATRVTLDPPAASTISLSEAAYAFAESEEEARLLDEEIVFRHEPVFEEPAGPPEPLPANLIEFPRQLVATRKARPRLAEGPLGLEDAPGDGQLRIFEVAPEQIAAAPESTVETETVHRAQWGCILLDSRPQADGSPSATAAASEAASTLQVTTRSLQSVASLQRRMVATAINMTIVGAGCVAFAAVFLWTASHFAESSTVAGGFAGRAAIESALPFAACAFGLLAAIYEALFFTFSTATPGMRVARIALCTFTDENPTRTAVRRRLPALLLSAAPMGCGFLWAALDEERLSWHDRICQIYQRSY